MKKERSLGIADRRQLQIKQPLKHTRQSDMVPVASPGNNQQGSCTNLLLSSEAPATSNDLAKVTGSTLQRSGPKEATVQDAVICF